MENSFKDQQTVVEKVENTDRTEESIPQTSKHVEAIISLIEKEERSLSSSVAQTLNTDSEDQTKKENTRPTFYFFLDESGILLHKFRTEGGELVPCKIAKNVDLSDFVRRVDEVQLRHERLFGKAESEMDMLEREVLSMNSDFDTTQEDEEDEEEEEDEEDEEDEGEEEDEEDEEDEGEEEDEEEKTLTPFN